MTPKADLAPQFSDALAALDAGDVSRLRAILGERPELLDLPAPEHAAEAGIYSGYFHGARLLHHLAGNPVRGPIPENAVEVLDVLLDAGADANATCGGGPAQPETGGGTLLGLVASSGAAAQAEVAPPLIDRLLQRGADPKWDEGGLLWLALYHTVECRAQREVAQHLRTRGAEVDLAYAAALGEADALDGFFAPDGTPFPEAGRFWPARHRGEPAPAESEVLLAEALVLAAANGADDAVVRLLGRGVDVDGWAQLGPSLVTPLHAAAWAGWPSTCRTLLERGADPTLFDPQHTATALGWATYCERRDAVAAFLDSADRLHLLDLLEHAPSEVLRERLADVDPNAPVPPGSPGVLLRVLAYNGREDLVEWLLSRGANPSLAGADQRTAADVARERGFHELARQLDEHDGKSRT